MGEKGLKLRHTKKWDIWENRDQAIRRRVNTEHSLNERIVGIWKPRLSSSNCVVLSGQNGVPIFKQGTFYFKIFILIIVSYYNEQSRYSSPVTIAPGGGECTSGRSTWSVVGIAFASGFRWACKSLQGKKRGSCYVNGPAHFPYHIWGPCTSSNGSVCISFLSKNDVILGPRSILLS